MDEGDYDACTRRSNRMAQRTCASINVDFVCIKPQLFYRSHSDYRKSLIDLIQIDIGISPTDFFVETFDCIYRCNGEFFGGTGGPSPFPRFTRLASRPAM